MKIHVNSIVTSVLRKLDENEEILREKESFGIPGTSLAELIEELLEETASGVILDASLSQLDNCLECDVEVDWEGPGRGSVSLPEDFLRLTCFRMSDWKRAVNKPIEYGSPSYELRFYPRKDRAHIRTSPAISIRGRVLEFIGSSMPGAYVERFAYVQIPFIDHLNCIEFPPSLLPTLTDALADRVRAIRTSNHQ